MVPNQRHKIFGVGPKGAATSLVLITLFAWVDARIFLPVLRNNFGLTKMIGIILVILGLSEPSGNTET